MNIDVNWITTLGLIAAICTAISYLPQAIKTIKTRQTKDLSSGMYIILIIGLLLWLIYGSIIKDVPIIVANSITLLLASIILTIKIKYK